MRSTVPGEAMCIPSCTSIESSHCTPFWSAIVKSSSSTPQ